MSYYLRDNVYTLHKTRLQQKKQFLLGKRMNNCSNPQSFIKNRVCYGYVVSCFVEECVTGWDIPREKIIFEELLTTFEAIAIFKGIWSSALF